MNNKTVIIGALLCVVGIVLGAFGAHGLKPILSVERLQSFETGVRYQMYAGFALFILGLNADRFHFSLKWIVRSLLIGIVLFSGSIYGLALQEVFSVSLKFLGPITPLGGLFQIIGWILLIYQLIKQSK
ncbi:MAG: DUF423 domain-containing protein [Crocinitomicaceae bacterium]|nr:DUF423 domain-containing protein [Crocinitomicaceae bacterium]